MVLIDEDFIIKTIQDYEIKNDCKTWDYALNEAQNPKNQLLSINKDVRKLNNLAQKANVKLPAIVLGFINIRFKDYASHMKCNFFDDENNLKQITDYFSNYVFDATNFLKLIYQLTTN